MGGGSPELAACIAALVQKPLANTVLKQWALVRASGVPERHGQSVTYPLLQILASLWYERGQQEVSVLHPQTHALRLQVCKGADPSLQACE